MLLPELIKNLLSRPVTEKYPKEKAVVPDSYRGVIKPLPGCIGCNICVINCPQQCITLHKGKRNWIEIDTSKCIACGLCEKLCPVQVIGHEPAYEVATKNKSTLKSR